MSLTLALDDISIYVDTLFHTIDCGIASFRIYEQKVILRITNHIVGEQFNSECERIVCINLGSFKKSVTDFEDLVTPQYKAVMNETMSSKFFNNCK